jgi:putative inorganic carbon (hco3(-)) transporter
VWSWLGYMNPHRLGWGFAYDLPLAFIVAITTFIAVVLSREPKRFPVTMLTTVWMLFVAWMIVTTIFAFYPTDAWVQCQKVLKIQLMTFAAIVLMTSRERLRMLIWIIVLSLGFFGVKGGIFTIIHGGDFHVWGPPESFVEGNNELALALLMILPLMQYLRITSAKEWVRWGLLGAMALCSFSIVGSQSRGALLGGLAMGIFLCLKSRHKVITTVALVLGAWLLVTFMPGQWHDRMHTIETYEEDASAMGRIQTWKMTLNLASDKLTGGGFELWTADTFDRYSIEKKVPNDAHSIYFKVLAEHGWPGLILFVIIVVLGWRTGTWIIQRTAGRDDLAWLSDLARMIQVSLAAYAVGGAFLGLSYFDLYWHLIAMLVVGKALLQQHELVNARNAGQRHEAAPARLAGVTGLRLSSDIDADRGSTT